MLKAFVGIADCYGLDVVPPPREKCRSSGWPRATTLRSRQAVCFWAVVGDEAAREIRSELDGRHPLETLTALGSLATEIIRVTSAESVPAFYHHAEDPIADRPK